MAEGKSRVDVGRRQFLGGAGVAGAAAAAAHALTPVAPGQRADAGAGRAPDERAAAARRLHLSSSRRRRCSSKRSSITWCRRMNSPRAAPTSASRPIIDRALAGSWGKGDRLYMQGPWQRGTRQPGLPASAHAGRALSRRHRGLQRTLPQGLRADLRPLHGRAEGNVPARTLRRQDHARGRPARPHVLRRCSIRT